VTGPARARAAPLVRRRACPRPARRGPLLGRTRKDAPEPANLARSRSRDRDRSRPPGELESAPATPANPVGCNGGEPRRLRPALLQRIHEGDTMKALRNATLALLFAILAGPVFAQKPVTIRFPVEYAANFSAGLANQDFVQRIEAASNGRIKVRFAPGGTMYKGNELVHAL